MLPRVRNAACTVRAAFSGEGANPAQRTCISGVSDQPRRGSHLLRLSGGFGTRTFVSAGSAVGFMTVER
jgi:hypothetical protein